MNQYGHKGVFLDWVLIVNNKYLVNMPQTTEKQGDSYLSVS